MPLLHQSQWDCWGSGDESAGRDGCKGRRATFRSGEVTGISSSHLCCRLQSHLPICSNPGLELLPLPAFQHGMEGRPRYGRLVGCLINAPEPERCACVCVFALQVVCPHPSQHPTARTHRHTKSPPPTPPPHPLSGKQTAGAGAGTELGSWRQHCRHLPPGNSTSPTQLAPRPGNGTPP